VIHGRSIVAAVLQISSYDGGAELKSAAKLAAISS
jgi:hypothetical protein